MLKKILFYCSFVALPQVHASSAYIEELKDGTTVWMKRDSQDNPAAQITIGQEIAVGGNKVAVSLRNKEEILMVPKGGREYDYDNQRDREIEGAQAFAGHDLLNGAPQRVWLYGAQACDENNLIGKFYVAPSFASLQDKEPYTYVFDVRHRNISNKKGQHWDLKNQSLLSKDQRKNPYDLSTWQPMFKGLLEDINTIVDNDLHLSMDDDTLNLAFIRDRTLPGGYKIHIFVFDFCEKKKRFFDAGMSPKLSENEEEYIKSQYLNKETMKIGIKSLDSSQYDAYDAHLLKKKCINYLIEHALAMCFWTQEYYDLWNNSGKEKANYPEPGEYSSYVSEEYKAIITQVKENYYDIIAPSSDDESADQTPTLSTQGTPTPTKPHKPLVKPLHPPKNPTTTVPPPTHNDKTKYLFFALFASIIVFMVSYIIYQPKKKVRKLEVKDKRRRKPIPSRG